MGERHSSYRRTRNTFYDAARDRVSAWDIDRGSRSRFPAPSRSDYRDDRRMDSDPSRHASESYSSSREIAEGRYRSSYTPSISYQATQSQPAYYHPTYSQSSYSQPTYSQPPYSQPAYQGQSRTRDDAYGRSQSVYLPPILPNHINASHSNVPANPPFAYGDPSYSGYRPPANPYPSGRPKTDREKAIHALEQYREQDLHPSRRNRLRRELGQYLDRCILGPIDLWEGEETDIRSVGSNAEIVQR